MNMYISLKRFIVTICNRSMSQWDYLLSSSIAVVFCSLSIPIAFKTAC